MDIIAPRRDATVQSEKNACLGWWRPADLFPSQEKSVLKSLRQVNLPLFIVERNGALFPESHGVAQFGAEGGDGLPMWGYVPPLPPEQFGDPDFCHDLGIRYPYLGGSMAKGIASTDIVEELGQAGMLGFFGAAGLPLQDVESAVDRLSHSLGEIPHGFNLIHSPYERELEKELASLYIRKGMRIVEASAFLDLTLPLVRYRLHGIHRRDDGTIVTPNRIIAKVSREEMATKFLSPPPENLLRDLLAAGEINAEQAELAAGIPMAQEVTAEADSGGHTDNRPAIALFPTILSLARRLETKYGYNRKLRIGLAGGISTPASAAAAFAMGAAYIMTGSVNQACIESGTSEEVKAMLAETRQADVTMAPSADMFEMGVTVQVLKRGTMFPMRAAKLYEIYRAFPSLEDIPLVEREKLEKNIFHAPFSDVWRQTHAYFLGRDPGQAERGERDAKHRMALVFRWYLGQAAHWAKCGEASRRIDYQVWCGPSMGAFNEWAAGSPLESPSQRRVATVALNILFGASVITRANYLRCQGITLPVEAMAAGPLELSQIKEYFR